MSEVLFRYAVSRSIKAKDLIDAIAEEWEEVKSENELRTLSQPGLEELAGKSLDDIIGFETRSAVLDAATLTVILAAAVGGAATGVAQSLTDHAVKGAAHVASTLWKDVLLPRIKARYGSNALEQQPDDSAEDN